ncbi:MAG: membrane protease YdiL (CAAX protease family) [Planctomycetota bacterium]|jgi:membrane protease YdiL (CAAX protease family)
MDCAECGQPWRIHENMAGFRFACSDCGGWVDVPQPAAPTPLQIATNLALEGRREEEHDPSLDAALVPFSEQPRDEDGLVTLNLPEGRVYEGDIQPGDAVAPGTLQHVRNDVRQRWTSRTALEITLMFLALVGPPLTLFLWVPEDDAVVLLPVASLIGGFLVVLIGFSAPKYTFGGLRRASPWYFLEATAASALALGAAVFWMSLIRGALDSPVPEGGQFSDLKDLLGPALLVCVVAVAPGILEELAFRGLLQGRLMALMGRHSGILTGAALFALAHGFSLATPLHLGIGVYLGYLKDRCGSLLPGMWLHFSYNGTLALFLSP